MKDRRGISLDEYRQAAYFRWVDCGQSCECCGDFIPLGALRYSNFAHTKSRSKLTRSEILSKIVVVCEVLHIYQHTRSKNLEAHHCVSGFLRNYPPKKGNFWGAFLAKREVFTEA